MKIRPNFEARPWFHSRVARLIVALLVVLPLTNLALYMWAGWDPTHSVNRMPVALVNADQPVHKGDLTLSSGATVTANLLDSHALDFEVVDHDEAMSGLARGDYYFVIEIPAGFSATLADMGTTTIAPALIGVTYNDNNNVLASTIGAQAMTEIGNAVRAATSATAIGTLLDGLRGLGGGLRSAADGSAQLHGGTSQLTDGLDQLTAGITTQLVPALSATTHGSGQLADGAHALSTGLIALRNGTDQLGGGARQISDGVDQLVQSVNVDSLAALADSAKTQLPADPSLDELRKGIDQIGALLKGLLDLRTGTRQLAEQLTSPDAGYRGGLDQLVDGSQQLASGATDLSTGMARMQAGGVTLSDGAQQLSAAGHQIDDGAGALANGLAQGAQAVPVNDDAGHRTSLAQLLGTPVGTDPHNLAPAKFGGPGGAPLFLILCATLLPVVVFMCIRPHRGTGRGTPGSAARELLRRFAAVAVVSSIAVAAVALLQWSSYTPVPHPDSTIRVIAVIALATIMNSAITAALMSVFGYPAGILAGLAALMVQYFCFGGIWMIETLPAWMRWAHPVVPMTYVRDGLLSAFNGAPGFGLAMAIMAAITLVAMAICLATTRTSTARYPIPLAAELSRAVE
ncbi:YhgE/Pip domain-containing protein [Nocardia sp. NPDC056100]|uniref:YhgE/Pip domain-containing protein n=1 Tax=Nocardia sp. NPDC056100 TaxID=3345712 RepID=UPI0035D8D3A0